jgi:hypothetical protein
MKKMEFTKEELYKIWLYVAESFERRSISCGYKAGSKKRREMQLEYFIGAVQAIDCLTGAQETNQTCCPPVVLFSGIRGDDITPEDFKPKTTEK